MTNNYQVIDTNEEIETEILIDQVRKLGKGGQGEVYEVNIKSNDKISKSENWTQI